MDMFGLIRKRGGVKHKLTSFINFLKPIFEQFNRDSSSLSEETIIELEERLHKLTLIFSELDEVQALVEASCDEGQLDGQYKEQD
ncbi:hypothetical protein RN001_008663 [Aquatica leii]|uniref:Uncharacterized protein n=1 Tax=Aquatica leii TaxID=1421715 RepID=A0AAN7SGZ8_9COLE|nr:hypothetical protein RN001_008663 [Aquatica leii]